MILHHRERHFDVKLLTCPADRTGQRCAAMQSCTTTCHRGFEAAMTSGRTRLHGRATLTRAISRTGQKLYVEMTFAMVKNHEGEVLGSVAIARDVTARVEQEKSVARHGGER